MRRRRERCSDKRLHSLTGSPKSEICIFSRQRCNSSRLFESHPPIRNDAPADWTSQSHQQRLSGAHHRFTSFWTMIFIFLDGPSRMLRYVQATKTTWSHRLAFVPHNQHKASTRSSISQPVSVPARRWIDTYDASNRIHQSTRRTRRDGAPDGSDSSLSQFTLETNWLAVKRDFGTASALYAQNVASARVTIPQLRVRVADLEREQLNADFWKDANAARALDVTQQLSQSSRLLARLLDWEQWYGDAQAALEMLAETSASHSLSLAEQEMLLEECTTAVQALWTDGQHAALEWLLSGPYDACPAARLLITAGAGGTEANDWVADLVRMYTRYLDQKSDDWSVRILDATPGDVVGYKSVELLVQGPCAYGWCRSEKGAHRLVRLSPFNAKDKRQTTFAGVEVIPELHGTSQALQLADIVLEASDLDITTMRSGGKGGQNVNKVNSAVRIQHRPSGLSVKCTDERSQAQNKDIALNRLKAQLLILAQEQRVQEINDIRGDVVDASWGAQIRNYVLFPYQIVKDQRTGWETTNTQAFLDGDVTLLDDCIGAFLRHQANERLETSAEQ